MKTRLSKLLIYGLMSLVILVGCKARETPLSSPEDTAVQPSPISTQTESLKPTSQIETVYPEPSGPSETAYPQPDSPTQALYPAPTEGLLVYPEPTGQVQQAYPGPTEPAQFAYPDPTQPVSAYPGLTQPVPAYPGPTQPAEAYPSPVQSTNLANTAQATTAGPSVSLAPATTTSTPVPTNTPLASLTPMPTVTPTPALPPPIRRELSATDPDQFNLGSEQVQLVEFFAYWCVTCRSMAPDVHSLEALYSNRVNFVYLDIDDPANAKHQRALGYRYQPHFFLLDKDGKILRQWIGWVTTDELRNAIDAALR